jgi:glycosyltransferase involved in cell wall biosynthesis
MLVEFIIPTYNRIDPLRCILSSLMSQNDNDWKATVIQDGNDNLEYIIDELDDPRIIFSYTEERYDDWGHSLREIAKQKSVADYIVMTNDDNYYTPNLVKELKIAAKLKPGMIYWDMVHSHYNYQYFNCKPIINEIDMGAFATRNDLAKQIKMRTIFPADGEYVRDFCNKFPGEAKVKINKILFVHN